MKIKMHATWVHCVSLGLVSLLVHACSQQVECRSIRESQNTHPFDGGKGAKFTHWRWESKQENWDYKTGIMIGLDFNFSEVATCTNHVRRTVATGWEDRHVEWEIHVTDVQPVEFTLDGVKYDLAKGSLFLVTTAAGRKQIQQLDEKLPEDTNELESFGMTNAVVARFIEEARRP